MEICRGRQGARGRTHLMSPVMAAAAALTGRLTDVRKIADWNTTSAKASPRLDMTADVAEIESDDDIERIGDLPEDGQQTGMEDSKRPSLGMPPFTTLLGIGKLSPERRLRYFVYFPQLHHSSNPMLIRTP